jgi:hypothetical protein
VADRLFTTQLDSGTSQDFDGAWHNLGTRFQLSANGTLTGGRAFFPSPKPTTQFIWAVFRMSDQAVVAQCDLLATFGSPALGAWNTFTSASFSTPGDVALSASEEYIVVTATDRDVIFKNTGVSYPVTSGGIVSGSEARWLDGGTGLQYPTGIRTTDWYGADVEVVTAASAAGAPARVQYPPPWMLRILIAANARDLQTVVGDITQTVDATDTMGLTDSASFDVAATATDSMGLVDSVGLATSTGATDSMGLTDTALAEVSKVVAATDTMGLTDSAAFAVAKPVTDSMGLVDSAGLSVATGATDSMGLTDSASVMPVHSVDTTDTMGLTDSAIADVFKVVNATDSMGLADSASFALSKPVTDSMGLVDSVGLATSTGATDSMGLTDSVGMSTARPFTDSMGLTDSAVAMPVKFVDATDTMGLTDDVTTQTGLGTILLPTGLVPVRTFTADELLTGNRMTTFRFDLFTRAEAALGNLDGVEKGEVDFTSSASVHSGGALEIVDNGQSVDWLNDRVRPVVIIDGLPEIRLGMFVFSEAPEEWGDTGRSWPVKLLDKTSILDQDEVEATYSLDAGTVITTAVATLITSTGETNLAVTPSTATLAGPLSWEAGTSKLKIVNDLLSVAGYFSLYCNGDGQFIAKPYVRPAARPIRYEFLDGEQAIYSPDFVKDVDLFAIPNKFIAVGKGDATTAALVAVATNTDPASPYSIANRGRTIAKSVTGIEAADQAVLDEYARRRLIELTSPTSSIDVAHMMVPDLTFNDAVRLRRVPAGVDARHVVTKMVVSFDATALVRSSLQEVVDL